MSKKFLLIFVAIFPFIIIGIILTLTYLPYLWYSKPEQDFIYVQYNTQCVIRETVVEEDVLQFRSNKLDLDCVKRENIDIYFHDVSNNQSTEINPEEFEKLKINYNSQGDQGYILEKSYGSFIFGSGSKVFLVGNGVKLEQNTSSNFIEFIGWVENS